MPLGTREQERKNSPEKSKTRIRIFLPTNNTVRCSNVVAGVGECSGREATVDGTDRLSSHDVDEVKEDEEVRG